MKKHLITAALVMLAVTPALAQPSVKTDTTVNVIYSGSSMSEAEPRFISETTTNRRNSETG